MNTPLPADAISTPLPAGTPCGDTAVPPQSAPTPQALRALILAAPTSGPYSEEARRDALAQLEQDADDPDALAQLARFWPDDYRAAVIDDNFRRRHLIDDILSPLLSSVPEGTPLHDRLLSLLAAVRADFLATQAPAIFDPAGHYLAQARQLQNENNE